jgi:hypothetical protein
MSRPHDRVWRSAPAPDHKRIAVYYNASRTHRSLNKDAPLHRAIERLGGAVVSRLSLAAFTISMAESSFRHTQATAWAASAERPCAKDEPPEARGTRSRGRKVTRSGPRVARPPPPRWASPRPLVIGGKMFDATFFARWTKRKMRRKIVCGSH